MNQAQKELFQVENDENKPKGRPKRRCSGRISECEHGHLGMYINSGEARELSGRLIFRRTDPAWQCFCCGFPMYDATGK